MKCYKSTRTRYIIKDLGFWSLTHLGGKIFKKIYILACKVHIFWESHKILRNLHLTFVLLMYIVPVKSKGEISQSFVAFSEYMNFIKSSIMRKEKLTNLRWSILVPEPWPLLALFFTTFNRSYFSLNPRQVTQSITFLLRKSFDFVIFHSICSELWFDRNLKQTETANFQ